MRVILPHLTAIMLVIHLGLDCCAHHHLVPVTETKDSKDAAEAPAAHGCHQHHHFHVFAHSEHHAEEHDSEGPCPIEDEHQHSKCSLGSATIEVCGSQRDEALRTNFRMNAPYASEIRTAVAIRSNSSLRTLAPPLRAHLELSVLQL